MAVLGRLLVSSAERLDLPDLLSIDSYAAGDWKYFLKGLVGDAKPFILKGFDVIDPGNAIGTQSCSIRVAESVTFYPGSNSGSFYHGLPEGHDQAAPLVPELRKNAVNYVYLTFSTFNTSVDTRAFWDPDKDGGVGGEFTQDINTESVLQVQVNVSTGSFPANTVPVAKVTVGPVVITAIEDARDMLFRLGSGGVSPNPFNTYNWRSLPAAGYERDEPPTTMQAGGVNPFQGADKNILSLKEWMDAVMSKLRELGGTTYWYDDTSSFGIITNFFDAVATTFKSKGQWIHDSGTPGLITWTEDIQIKMTSDPRTYTVRAGSKTLANEQVMYLAMVRNQPINGTDESVSWTNGQPYVNTVGGAVGLFANLSKGDYIKKANDSFDKYLRVEEFYDAVNLGGSTTTAAGARSVRLSGNYLGSTGVEKGRYDKGIYQPSDIVVSDRNQVAIANTGGNFHWLAMRSDTIENVGSVVSTSLSCAISEHDGQTAKVTATAHGLVDDDRITISGTTNFNGTYQVEVENANIFYITLVGGPFADESGTGTYATVTTAARSTPYGVQEESANHGFRSDDTIIIAGTTNYNNSYRINVRNATVFTIAIPAAQATETVGTATLARMIVRSEGSGMSLVQGQSADIGGSVADNIRQYVGMDSLSQTAPSYSIPPNYNTLDGMQNYNGIVGDNLTVRVSKLTAMMADKAQDKTVKYLPGPGLTTITNTTNGATQEITFTPSGAILTLLVPGSTAQAQIALPSSAPGISLLANQVAYVSIDRNNTTTPSILVANTASLTIDENIFVIAARLSSTEIYVWDGSIILSGSSPVPGFLPTVVRQNQTLKLVEGGTWAWDLGTQTVSWSVDAFVQIPGLANSVNTITAGSAVLAAGQVAYVDINRVAPGGTLTVTVAANASLALTTDRFIIARRENADVIVGLHSMRLVDGESKTIYSGSSDQTLAYIGSPSAGDDTPAYTSDIRGATGESLTARVDALTDATGDAQEDRSAFLRSDDAVTWTGTDLDFTSDIELQIINTKDGTTTSHFVDFAGSPITLNDGESAWVLIDRTNASETGLSVNLTDSTPIPAQTQGDKDVFVLFKRQDANGNAYLHIPLHKQLLAPGQSVMLGASGSGSTPKVVGGGVLSVVPASASIASNTSPNNDQLFIFGSGVSQGFTQGQTIVPTINSVLKKITLSLQRVGSPVGTFTLDLYNTTVAGLGFAPTGAPIAQSTVNLDVSTIGLSYSTYDFDFTGVPVLAGTHYAWVVNMDNMVSGDVSNAIRTQMNIPASVAGNGVQSNEYPPTTWNANVGYDLYFDVQGETLDLEFTEDLYLEVAGKAYVDNTIDATASSPISFTADNQVAYVIPNVGTGGPALSVTVTTLDLVPSNAVIIARQISNGMWSQIIVGSSSTGMGLGQSTDLYAQESFQTRNTIRSVDWLRSDDEVTWTGTELQFSSDIVLETINTYWGTQKQFSIDSTAESPIAIANGEMLYVVINRDDASGVVTPVVTNTPPFTLNESDEYIIIAQRIDANGAAYLHLPLHKQVLEPGQSVRLGASGSGSEVQEFDPAPGYDYGVGEEFKAAPASADDTINQTLTNATFDSAKKLYALALDKSKTVATNTGTAITINSAPTFTVAVGDIIYVTSGARVNQWRKIATVNSQTSFVLDAAFAGGDTTGGDTLMVSQAVYTKDLVNFGDAAQLNRARDFYPARSVGQILLNYGDSLTAGDDVPDFTQTARIVAAATNTGLQTDVTVPLSSDFSVIYTRPAAPNTLPDYLLSASTPNERLLMVFFPNPTNVSVTANANLVNYDVSFYEDAESVNGGVLASAFGSSDNSTTAYNCTISTVSSLTRLETNFAIYPSADPGGVGSQVNVEVNGQGVPKYVSPSVTPGLAYTIVQAADGIYRRIQFTQDLSVAPVEIKIFKQFGVYDASFEQTARLTGLHEAIVGSAAQVTAGTATHTTLQAAHDAIATGGLILIQNNVTLTGNTTISKRCMIQGKGPGSVLTGNLTITSTAAGSIFQFFKVTGNIELQAGADRCFLTQMYQSSAGTYSDDPSNVDNEPNIITE